MNTLASRLNFRAMQLLSTGLFVALAGGVMLRAEAASTDSPGGHRHGGAMMTMDSGMGGGMMMRGLMSGRMLDAVNATPEQRTQLKQIMELARADLKVQRESGRGLHEQARQLFIQPTVDARAAESLRVQLVAQHDQGSKRMMQAMLEVSRVLTPEQRAKMAEMAGQRRAMMEQRRSRAN